MMGWVGWGGVGWGMLTFVWICWGSWCYADDGVGGVGWGGVGWGGVGHVNVRVNLLRFLMLRWWWGGVGWGHAIMLLTDGARYYPTFAKIPDSTSRPHFPVRRDIYVCVYEKEHSFTTLCSFLWRGAFLIGTLLKHPVSFIPVPNH